MGRHRRLALVPIHAGLQSIGQKGSASPGAMHAMHWDLTFPCFFDDKMNLESFSALLQRKNIKWDFKTSA